MEIWKAIKGFEEQYEVSNIGNIRSIDRVVKHYIEGFTRKYKGTAKNTRLSTDGYLKCNLKNNKNAQKYIVQDLITGQIAGNYTDRMVEDVLELYNNSSASIMGKEPERAPRTFRQYEIFKMMGVYGIPIVNGFEAIENLSKFVEPSSVYRQQKFGYIDPYDKIKIEG